MESLVVFCCASATPAAKTRARASTGNLFMRILPGADLVRGPLAASRRGWHEQFPRGVECRHVLGAARGHGTFHALIQPAFQHPDRLAMRKRPPTRRSSAAAGADGGPRFPPAREALGFGPGRERARW